MTLVNRFLCTLLAFEWLCLLLLSAAGVFNILYIEYVPSIFFATSVLLLPVLLYASITRPAGYAILEILMLLGVALVLFCSSISVFITGLFTAQFFGQLFNPTTTSALFIFAVHAFTFSYIRANSIFSFEQSAHVLGATAIVLSVLQSVSGSPDYGHVLMVFVFWYAVYCTFKIDYEDARYPVVTGVGFTAALLVLIFVPVPFMFGILCFLVIGAYLAYLYRPTIFFAGPLLITAAVVFCVFTAINPGRLDVQHTYVVTLDWVPTMFARAVVQEPDMYTALFGRGPTTASNIWLTEQPVLHFATVEFEGDPEFIGSFAFTHALTNGFLGSVAWLFFFIVLMLKVFVRTDTTNRVHSDQNAVSLLLLFVTGVLFLSAVSLAALLLCALALGLSVMHTTVSRSSKFYTVLATVIAVVLLLVSLLAVKHTVSMVFSYTYLSHGVKGVVDGRYDDALWFFKIAEETRSHASLLRAHAQLLTRMLENELRAAEPSKDELDRYINEVLDLTDEAISLNPFDYRNWMVKGNLYFILTQMGIPGAGEKANGAYAEARAVAEHKIEIDYMLAQLALKRGYYSDAQNYLDTLISMYPDDKKIIEMSEYLDEKMLNQ